MRVHGLNLRAPVLLLVPDVADVTLLIVPNAQGLQSTIEVDICLPLLDFKLAVPLRLNAESPMLIYFHLNSSVSRKVKVLECVAERMRAEDWSTTKSKPRP